MMIRYSHCLLGLFLSMASTAVAKDPPVVLPPPPPMAQAASISMYRGQSIEIPLRALGRAPNQLKFIIRNQPLHGKLGDIRIIDKKNAVVTYTHNDKEGQGTDIFSFAAQAQDSPVSAAAQISITITEKPPELTAPSSVNFGSLLVGETHQEVLTIINTGGGKLSGQLKVTEPWRIVGSTDYQLARRQRQQITLEFLPRQAQSYVGQLSFSGDQSSPVILMGQATAPIEVAPSSTLEFSSSAPAEERSGNLTLRNLTDQERTVNITAPQPIIAPRTITIPPGDTRQITLRIAPDFKNSLEDFVTMDSEGFSQRISFRIFALAPILKITPLSPIDFGPVQTGRQYKQSFQLKNEGGLNASLAAVISPELLLIPNPASIVLAPEETRTFEITLQPAASGPWKGSILIRASGGNEVRVDTVASISPASGPSAKPSATPPAALPLPSPAQSPLISTAPDHSGPLSAIPPVSDLISSSAGRNEIHLVWRRPATNARSYIVEWRHLTFVGGQPQIRWEEWKGLSFQEENDHVTAHFGNLAPGRTWYIRIRTVDETGLRSAPSSTIRMATLPQPRSYLAFWLGGLVLVSALFFIIRWWRQNKRQRDDSEAARIKQLEQP